MTYTSRYMSPLGEILLASDGQALTGLWFEGQKHYARGLGEHREAALPVFCAAAAWLEEYFAGREPAMTVPLRPAGTEFQQAVWQLLQAIPYGEQVSYGELAEQLARQRGLARMSARAVGGAVGRNPISVLVPCHRVVGKNGTLTGYAGGEARKGALLELEKGMR